MGTNVLKNAKPERLSRRVRREIAPLLKELGFANPKDRPPNRGSDVFPVMRANTWVRVVDGFRDEICFSWDRDGGCFWLEGQTDRPGRVRYFKALSRRRRILWGLFQKVEDEFASFEHLGGSRDGRRFPYRPDPVPLAAERIRELDRYLRTGEVGPHIARYEPGRRPRALLDEIDDET